MKTFGLVERTTESNNRASFSCVACICIKFCFILRKYKAISYRTVIIRHTPAIRSDSLENCRRKYNTQQSEVNRENLISIKPETFF